MELDVVGDELVSREGNIAETSLGVARRVDVIVLHTTRCRDGSARSFNEGRQGPCDTKPPAGEFLLSKEHAVNETPYIVFKQHFGKFLAVDRAFFQPAKLRLDLVEERLVAAFQQVRAVN